MRRLGELPSDPIDLTYELFRRRDQMKELVGEELYLVRIVDWKDALVDLNRKRGEEAMLVTAIEAAGILVRKGHGPSSNWIFAACVELAAEVTHG